MGDPDVQADDLGELVYLRDFHDPLAGVMRTAEMLELTAITVIDGQEGCANGHEAAFD